MALEISRHRGMRRFPNTTAGKLAYQLGWFSIALGSIELFGARKVTRTLGMRGQEDLIRAYGVREIAKGVGILTSSNPTPWLWGRVAGDALDLGTLALAYRRSPRPKSLALAFVNVAAVTALDLMAAQQLGAIQQRQTRPARDYSDRIGLPMGLEASRGAAKDAMNDAAFQTPAPMRPWTTTDASDASAAM